MKRILATLSVLVVLAAVLFPAAVLADDPPDSDDTDVDVTVTSGGNVNLGVDIDASGEVIVTIDGVPLWSTLDGICSDVRLFQNAVYSDVRLLQSALCRLAETYGKDMASANKSIADLQLLTKLLADAEAKLINDLRGLGGSLESDRSELLGDIASLNKIVFAVGARVTELEGMSAANASGISDVSGRLDIFTSDAKQNIYSLSGDLTALSEELATVHTVAANAVRVAWIAGAVALVAVSGCIYLIATRKKS